MMRSSWGSQEHAELTRQHDDLVARRNTYLRQLLAQLPFRWHVEHAYTPRETATYGGADHIVVDEALRIGRLVRQPGDALSRARAKFWGLHTVAEPDRLPTSLADIQIAERLVAAPAVPAKANPKRSSKQLDAEIAEALRRR